MSDTNPLNDKNETKEENKRSPSLKAAKKSFHIDKIVLTPKHARSRTETDLLSDIESRNSNENLEFITNVLKLSNELKLLTKKLKGEDIEDASDEKIRKDAEKSPYFQNKLRQLYLDFFATEATNPITISFKQKQALDKQYTGNNQIHSLDDFDGARDEIITVIEHNSALVVQQKQDARKQEKAAKIKFESEHKPLIEFRAMLLEYLQENKKHKNESSTYCCFFKRKTDNSRIFDNIERLSNRLEDSLQKEHIERTKGIIETHYAIHCNILKKDKKNHTLTHKLESILAQYNIYPKGGSLKPPKSHPRKKPSCSKKYVT